MSKVSKTIKVRIKKEFLNLKEILPLGFETELNILVSEKDVVIPARMGYITNNRGVIMMETLFMNEQTIPAGNYEGFTFKGANNKIYDNKNITNAIGFIPIKQIFQKI